jgi:hypothetical protein
MYAGNVKREFKLMPCFISLKQCGKWWQTRALLKKASEGVIYLDAPLGTLAGYPIDNKKAKAAATQESSSERMTASIDKWQASMTMQVVMRAAKADERWAAIMEKQEKKIELETTRVVVKKRKEYFMILTADTSNMDDKVKAMHLLFHDAILQKMGLCRAPATATAATPPDQQMTSPKDVGATQPPVICLPIFVQDIYFLARLWLLVGELEFIAEFKRLL